MKSLSRHGDKAEILARLRTLRPDTGRTWGRMSAHQMVCHLADWSRMVLGQKPMRVKGGLFHRTALKWFVLYAPVPWPHGIPTATELDQERGGTRPVDFAADLAEAESLLEIVTAPNRGLDRPPHPIFGPMSDAEWLRLGYLHTDHHLRQFGA